MPYPLLAITDGVTCINLISKNAGLHMTDWLPQPPTAKGGGVWQDGQLSDGRRLAVKKWNNVTDSFALAANNTGQNSLIYIMQDLRRLLEKATAYWTNEWQSSPVWIEAVASCETNPRYAIIHDYQLAGESSPYAKPFAGGIRAAFGELTLALEHGPWLSQPPGTGECVETTSLQADWPIAPWAINSALPVGICYAMVQLTTGRLLAPDTNGAGSVVWRTDDGGATPWTASAAFAVAVKAVAQGRIYVYAATLNAGGGGIYRSADYGATWALVNAVHFGDRFSLKYRPLDGYMYLLDSDTRVMHRSIDLGANWVDISGGIANSVGFVIQPNGDIFMASLDGYFYKSVNGTTWVAIGRLPTFITYTAAFCALFNPGDGYMYFTGFSSVTGFTTWRSTDGTSWMDISDPDFATMTGEIIYSSSGVLYCAKISGLIYHAQAGGLSWANETTVTTPAYSMVERTTTRKIYVGATGDIWAAGTTVTVGQTATCESEVFSVNKNNPAQLTGVWRYTVAGAVWDLVYALGVFPFFILPAVPAVNDICYFGILTSCANSGPFNNLVFNVGVRLFATSWTIAWEYWNGAAWAALPNVKDGTNGFANTGVNSVHWEPPADWAVTPGPFPEWRIRARVSAIAGSVSGPQQATRDIYTVNTSSLTIAASQVPGDMPALLHAWLTNRSDGGTLAAWANRYILGLRSTSRGSTFAPFLNFSSTQQPLGLTIAGTAATVSAANIQTATGRQYTHTNPGGAALSVWADQFTFTFSGTLAAAYYGRFRAFLRAQQAAGAAGDVRVRLKVQYGLGGQAWTGDYVTFPGTGNWQLLDLGSMLFPPSSAMKSTDAGNSMVITLQVWSSVARVVNLYDLALIPTDEWSADLVDTTNLGTVSGVGAGDLLELDSVSFPKQEKRAVVRGAGAVDGMVNGLYSPITAGPASLQANTDQKLYVLCARYAAAVWYSEPWIAHSAKLEAAFRYLLMRGSR